MTVFDINKHPTHIALKLLKLKDLQYVTPNFTEVISYTGSKHKYVKVQIG